MVIKESNHCLNFSLFTWCLIITMSKSRPPSNTKSFQILDSKSFPHQQLRRNRFDKHWKLKVEKPEKHDFNLTLVDSLKARYLFLDQQFKDIVISIQRRLISATSDIINLSWPKTSTLFICSMKKIKEVSISQFDM